MHAEPTCDRGPVYRRFRWQIFGITWLTYVVYYLPRKSFSVAKVVFDQYPQTGISLSRADYGLIDSSYLVAYAFGQFLWGPLADRLGPRRVLLGGISLVLIAAVGSGFCSHLFGFALFAVVLGLGQSTGWPSLLKTVSAWFSVGERGRLMGWWCTNYAVGAAIAAPFAAWVMLLFARDGVPSWQAGFWGPAVVMLGVFVLVTWLHRDRPEDVGLVPIANYVGNSESTSAPNNETISAPDRSWQVVAEVLRVRAVWLLAVSYFGVKLTRYAFYFWGPKYVSELLGSGTATSAITSAALPIGGIVGVLAAGYISDNLLQSRRIPVTIVSLALSVLVLVIVQFVTIPNTMVLGGFFFAIGFFLFGPDAIISGTAAMDMGTSKGAGTAAGFINGVGSIGAILGGFLPGVITTKHDWSSLFYVFIVGLVVSALVLIPLWNTQPPKPEN